MNKYYVTFDFKGTQHGFTVYAHYEGQAIRRAVIHAQNLISPLISENDFMNIRLEASNG